MVYKLQFEFLDPAFSICWIHMGRDGLQVTIRIPGPHFSFISPVP